jgi:hypothetical protein
MSMRAQPVLLCGTAKALLYSRQPCVAYSRYAATTITTAAVTDTSTAITTTAVTATLLLLPCNSAVADKFGRGMMGFYKGKGLVQKFENAAEAATLIGADPDALAATLAAYTQAAAAGTDEFGKVTFPVCSNYCYFVHNIQNRQVINNLKMPTLAVVTLREK